jgi:hypothetical protein
MKDSGGITHGGGESWKKVEKGGERDGKSPHCRRYFVFLLPYSYR